MMIKRVLGAMLFLALLVGLAAGAWELATLPGQAVFALALP